MSELTHEQLVEMHAEKRRLHGIGEVSGAAAIAAAIQEDRFFLGVEEPESSIDPFEVPSKGGSKKVWQAFALKVSDIEPEIINSATRNDIIGMLVASGYIE